MADLPENTSYAPGGAPTPPKLPSLGTLIRGNSQVSLAPPVQQPNLPNVLGAYSPISTDVSDMTNAIASGQNGFNVETPLGAPSADKYSPTPPGYSAFKTGGGPHNPLGGVAPVTPVVRQEPTGGQMNLDTSNPQHLIKQERYLPPHENSLILGPLSQSMFQVDHIVPLWAGGADTLANKQTLPVPVHEAKTKIQAVPETLFYEGDIDLNTARAMALTWQNRSANGIPEVDDKGSIPVETARAIAARWKKQDSEPYNPSLGDILKSVPEAANNFGKGKIPEFLRQLIVGGASGLTAGAVPLESSQDANAFDKIAGLAGMGLGTVAGISLFGGLTEMAGAALGRGLAGRALGGLAGKMGITAASGRTVGDLLGGAKMFEPAAEAITAAGKASKGIAGVLTKAKEAADPRNVISSLKAMNVKAALAQGAKNAVAFGAYGQAGQTLADFTQPQQNVLAAHTNRLANDLVLGGLTGAIPGTWKGSAGVGAGTLVLGLMNGDSPREALSNAVAISALHKVGGFSQDAKAQQAQQAAATDDAATKGAFTVLHNMVGETVPKIDLKSSAPTATSYKPEDVQAWTKQALANLNEMGIRGTSPIEGASKITGGSGGLTPEQFMAARAKIMAAGKYLETRTLPADLQEKSAMLDLTSMARHLDGKYDVDNISTPNSLLPFVNKMGEMDTKAIDERPPFNMENGRWIVEDARDVGEGLPENNGVRGDIRLTGQAASLVNEDRLKAFMKAFEEGNASPVIYLARQPEMAPFWRDMNRSITPEMQKSGEHFIDAHPENFINAFGLIKDPTTGAYKTFELGSRVPSKERIGVPSIDEKGKPIVTGNKYAFNKDPEIRDGKWPQENPDFNKDTIGTAMANRGLSVVPARVKIFSQQGLKSGKPYLIAHIGDKEWETAKNTFQQLGKPEDMNSFSENMGAAMDNMGKRNAEPLLLKAASQLAETGESAPSVLRQVPVTPATEQGNAALTELTDKARDVVLKSETPEQLAMGFKEELGVELTPEEATQMEATKEKMTAGNLIETVDKAVNEGRADPMTVGSYRTYVRPVLRTQSFKNSTAGSLFDKMPLISSRDVGERRATRLVTNRPGTTAPSMTSKGIPFHEAQQAVKDDLTAKLDSIFENYEAPTIIGRGLQRADIIKDLRGRLGSVNTDRRGLSGPEYESVKKQVLDEYGAMSKAADYTHTIIPPSEEAEYLSGSAFPDEASKNVAENVIRADTSRRLGLNENVTDILKNHTPEELDKARKALFPKMMGESDDEWNERTKWLTPEGAKEAPTAAENEARAEYNKENVPLATKRAAASFFKEVNDGIDTLPKTSYGYSFYRTISDGLARAFSHSKQAVEDNYDLARFLSENNQVGRSFFKDLFSTIDERTGKPFSQPKTRTEAMAKGAHGAQLREMSNQRNEQLASEGADAYAVPKEILQTGMANKVETEAQSPSENYQDLTRMEAQVTPGIVALQDGKIGETDAGIEDGKRFLQHLMKQYNTYLRAERERGNGGAGRKTANLMKPVFDKDWSEISDSVRKESEEHGRVSQLVQRAKNEVTELEKRSENLANVGGTRAMELAKKDSAADKARIAQLKEFIEKNDLKKPDGQGGPGYDPLDPMAAVASELPGHVPGQSAADYVQGKTTYQKPTPLILDSVNIQPSIDASNSISDALSKPPKQAQDDGWFSNVQHTVGRVMDTLGGRSVVYGKQSPEGNPIISGIDTSDYATDPLHAQKLNNIMSSIGGALSSAADAEQYIRSKFPKSPVTGDMIAVSAKKWGVDPNLIVAIMQNDSSMGTAGLGAKTRNPGNVGNNDAGDVQKYPTWGSGVDAVAAWLSKHRAALASR